MSRSVWAKLGIPAGSDRAAIRRGYAVKLRQTHPEDDPEGFKALRAAYEQALAMAEAREWQAQHGDDEWSEDEDYDDTPREAVFTATPGPEERNATLTGEGAPSPHDADLLQGRDRDLAEFETRMNALSTQLASPWAQDEGALEAAFRHILAAPAMAEIGIRAHAEAWIAGLLASNVPKSDALLLQAIEAFGWDGAFGQRGQSPAVAAILHRIDEWRAIEALTSKGDQYHFAFNELTRPPRGKWEMRLKAINPGVAKRIRTLIDYSQWQMPGLRHSFNADTVAWWEDYLGQPRMTLGRLLLAPAVFAAVLALVALFAPVRTIVLIAGAVIAVAVPWAHLRIVGRLAHAREAGYGPDLPRWIERGWIAPVFALPVVAMFVPPSPSWAVALLVLAALAMQWTQLMSGGRRGDTGENPLSWILTIGIYGFFGFVPFLELPAETMMVLVTVAALVIHARLVAHDALAAIGEPLTQRFKLPGLAAIAALGGIALLSPLPPPFIAGTCFAVAALLLNAMFHGQIGWLRYATRVAIALAFLVAAGISMPDRQTSLDISGTTTDTAMQRMEEDQPGFALLRQNNPPLNAELREIVGDRIAGYITEEVAQRRIGERLDAAYATMLPTAPDALLVDGLKLELKRREELLTVNDRACAGREPAGENELPTAIRGQSLTHMLNIVSVPAADRVSGSVGTPIRDAEIFRDAAARLRITPRILSNYFEAGATPLDHCRARIATLRAMLERPVPDIAATVRALHKKTPAAPATTPRRDSV